MKNSKIVDLFTLLVIIITAFQGLIPAMPMPNVNTVTLISAIAMFLASGLTIWKQALSEEISNKSLVPTYIVAGIATLGLLNELFNVIPLTPPMDQWIRFSITFITMVLNLISKIKYPTDATRSTI